MDRPAHHRSPHRAPRRGLDPPQALPPALPVRSPQRNLSQSSTRRDRRRGRALLHAIQLAAEEDEKGGHRLRGGSTITQQLVKNLLLGTSRSYLRKAAEFTLVPVAELVLGKQRILELYLNEVEWGPGIYGVEAASRAYYGKSARKIDRDEAARLAAILPLPLKRRPDRMDHYSEIILDHMREMGW